MTSLYIDGDIFVTEGGVLERFASGKSDGWEPDQPGDGLLREPPTVDLASGFGGRREGTVFAYDQPNARLVAYDKASGEYVGQYRLAGDETGWERDARPVPAAGRRGSSSDRRVDVQDGGPPGDPRGCAGRGRGVTRAISLRGPIRLRLGRTDDQPLTRGPDCDPAA